MGARKINLLGQKFFKLTVIEKVTRIKGEPLKWKCKCDCGNITITESKRLTGKYKTKGCKACGLKDMAKMNTLPDQGSLKNRSFRVYKRNAKSRNYEFHLSFKEFENLIIKRCHYCNELAKNSYSGFNGIDRKINIEGYTTENVVSCCSTCNMMKLDLGYEEFLDKIKSIYKNFQ